METHTVDLFFVLVILTGWTVAMGLGALLSWLFFEQDDNDQ